MSNETLKLKRRGDDGYRVTTIRVKTDLLDTLDKLAAEGNYSRNELINLILQYGVEHIVFE